MSTLEGKVALVAGATRGAGRGIAIDNFNEAMAKEIIGKVRSSKALILDLRGNPGGYVKTLEVFMGHFFEQDVK